VEFKQQKKKSNHVNKGDVTGQFNQHDNKHADLTWINLISPTLLYQK
jgi:hypothetical protein